jgi:peptidoglycan/xylan/chitin deacetylase (PgdA/CDA1 family)
MRDEYVFLGEGCGCEHHGTPGEPEVPSGASRRGFLRTAALTALTAPALLAAACGNGSGTKSGGGAMPTGSGPGGSSAPGTTGASASGGPSSRSGNGLPGPETADAALLHGKYGLKPFAPAPPPPAVKPVKTDLPLPPVVSYVPLPLDQKLCFLTIDDGAEKDPAFIQMVQDFRIPVTMFLTDAMIKDDYDYFKKLLDTGYCTIQNHTLTHPNMVQMSPERQKKEIQGQEAKLKAEYGVTPYLFRAPYGNSDKTTQEICKESGIKALMYWRATFQKQGFQWQAADKKLRAGDVLLAHFRGPKVLGKGWPEMHVLMTNLFRIVQDQGFTFARLEDYV